MKGNPPPPVSLQAHAQKKTSGGGELVFKEAVCSDGCLPVFLTVKGEKNKTNRQTYTYILLARKTRVSLRKIKFRVKDVLIVAFRKKSSKRRD